MKYDKKRATEFKKEVQTSNYSANEYMKWKRSGRPSILNRLTVDGYIHNIPSPACLLHIKCPNKLVLLCLSRWLLNTYHIVIADEDCPLRRQYV